MYKKLSILVISSAVLFSTNGCAAVAIGAVAVVAGTTAYVVTDARKTGTLVDDNTIATKLQSKISYNYPQTNINVSCYNGVVLLTGQADDKKSKDNIVFEAKTIFHEFGHALQMLFSNCRYP
ncbi:MAG: BON domain-containing protein, partial [Burkholderiales bacterium]|nr:BON domain-containing protein [Burkholderiales bacterium]